MKVSREQAAANRERIVEVAGKLFRPDAWRFLRSLQVEGRSCGGGLQPHHGPRFGKVGYACPHVSR